MLRKLFLKRKLIIIVVAAWLVCITYAVYLCIFPLWYVQHQEKLPPPSQATAQRGRYTLPVMPPTEDNVELDRMLDSDSYIDLVTANATRRGDLFDPRINATQIRQMVELMWMADDFCRQNGLVYFMYASTLIGSHRHHGIIPWDDDLDIMIPKSLRDRFLYLLRTRAPNLRMFTWAYNWKIWSPLTNNRIFYGNYGWPFVDVFFYGENDTHIYDNDPTLTAKYVYEKSIVFPLHYRPFMGRWLPAPRDTSQFLVRTVNDPEGCHSAYWWHDKEDAANNAVSTRCDMLKDRFPFTVKTLSLVNSAYGIMETLQLGNTELQSVLVKEPKASLTFNYSLRIINSENVRYAEPYS